MRHQLPTISHGVRVGQAEAGQVDHAVRQVDVKTAHRGLQVAQLVQHHHAALHHRHHRRSGRGAVSFEGSIHAVLHRVLLGEVSEEGQLLQTGDSLWKSSGTE